MTEQERFFFDHGYAQAKRDYSKVIEDIKAEIIEHAYPVCYDKNSIEKGMTLTGIMQAFDKHIGPFGKTIDDWLDENDEEE